MVPLKRSVHEVEDEGECRSNKRTKISISPSRASGVSPVPPVLPGSPLAGIEIADPSEPVSQRQLLSSIISITRSPRGTSNTTDLISRIKVVHRGDSTQPLRAADGGLHAIDECSPGSAMHSQMMEEVTAAFANLSMLWSETSDFCENIAVEKQLSATLRTELLERGEELKRLKEAALNVEGNTESWRLSHEQVRDV